MSDSKFEKKNENAIYSLLIYSMQFIDYNLRSDALEIYITRSESGPFQRIFFF